MKRFKFILLLLYSGLRCYSQSQAPTLENHQNHLISQFEILGGPSLSFLRGNPSVDNNEVNSRHLKLGYSFGLGLSHKFTTRIDGSALILIERKGGLVKRADTYFDENSQTLKEGNVEEEYIYDYYSLPIMVEYSFGRKVKYQVGAGPFISYLSKQIVRTTYYPQGAVGIEDQTSFNKPIDL